MILTLTSVIVWIVYLIALYILVFWLLVFLDNDIKEEDKKLNKYSNVTVVVPAFNEEASVEKTINSVLNLDYPRDKIKLIVVNDGSKDDTKNVVENIISKNKDRNIVLINQENSGKGAALNNALKNCNSEYFVCLDADSTVKEDALKKMLPYFDDETAVVLPLIKISKVKSFLEKLQWAEYLINFFYKKIMGEIDAVHVAPGPFSIYKTEVLKKLNGFDADNLTEDLEMTFRIQMNHYKVKQLLSVEVYTEVPNTFKEFYKQRDRWYKGTMLNIFRYREVLFNKKYGDFGVLQVPRVAIAGILAITMLFIVMFDYVFIPLLKRMYDLSYINYNIMGEISDFLNKFSFIDLNYTNIFFGVVIAVLSLFFIKMAYSYTREKIFKRGHVLALPIYYLSYGTLASIVWLGVFAELIFGKIQKW